MSQDVVMAAFAGFLLGDLPDEGLGWAIFKLVCAVAFLVLIIVRSRKDGAA